MKCEEKKKILVNSVQTNLLLNFWTGDLRHCKRRRTMRHDPLKIRVVEKRVESIKKRWREKGRKKQDYYLEILLLVLFMSPSH